VNTCLDDVLPVLTVEPLLEYLDALLHIAPAPAARAWRSPGRSSIETLVSHDTNAFHSDDAER
jgi:hypothetical protein